MEVKVISNKLIPLNLDEQPKDLLHFKGRRFCSVVSRTEYILVRAGDNHYFINILTGNPWDGSIEEFPGQLEYMELIPK